MKKLLCLLVFCTWGWNTYGDQIATTYELVPTEDFTQVLLPEGKAIYVKISDSSEPNARRALKTLKYSLFISTTTGTDRSPILLLGTLGRRIPGTMSNRKSEGIPDRVEFRLAGLVFRVPFNEYPQLPPALDYKSGPVRRDNIKSTDFHPVFDSGLIHFNADKNYYWIGEKP